MTGIGKAVAAALVREGGQVVLLGRDRAAVEEAAALLGRLDVVVNCAAPRALPGQVAGLVGLDDEDLLRNVDTKVLGYARVARAAAPWPRPAAG